MKMIYNSHSLPQIQNVRIAPAPSVGTSSHDGQHTQGPSFNAPDHMDYFIPMDKEVWAAYGKAGPFGLSTLVIYNSGLDTK